MVNGFTVTLSPTRPRHHPWYAHLGLCHQHVQPVLLATQFSEALEVGGLPAALALQQVHLLPLQRPEVVLENEVKDELG